MKINELLNENRILDWIKTGAQKVFSWATQVIKNIDFGQQSEINLSKVMGLDTIKEDKGVYSPTTTSNIDTDMINQPEVNSPTNIKNTDKVNDKPPVKKPINAKVTKDKFDLTSMIGYYNEFSVAWKLAYGLEHNHVNVKSNVDDGLRRHADNYRNYILDNAAKFKKPLNTIQTELKRVDDGSTIMAKKLWEEILDTHDLKLIDVEISLTGTSSAGIGKEDVLIKINKKSTEETKEVIKASLKLYKSGGGVNVYNSTFASYLVTVLTGKSDSGTGKKAIKSFLKDYPEYTEAVEDVLKITDQWLVIKNDLKKKKDPNYRKTANEFVTANRGYQKMRDLLFNKMFQDFYSRDKAAINERILSRLGLDGADDVYLLVGSDSQKMIPVSSRTSKKFGELYDQLKAGFNIRYDIPENPDIISCQLIIESEEGVPLAKITIGFKEGGTFPHMWNMTEIVKDAKRGQGIK
jgi:hypothetical protein